MFVIVISGYSNSVSGTQKVAAYLGATALSEKGDGKVGLAFTAAVVINQNCNQAVIASNEAFADVEASAVTDLNVECSWDFGEDVE